MARQDTIRSRAAEYQAIGEWLRKEREHAGLGQREVARALNQNQSFMWRVEHGQQRLDLLQFLDLSNVLKLDKKLTLEEIRKLLQS
jgi:transcriptional regulator with XRE-family HTH domain